METHAASARSSPTWKEGVSVLDPNVCAAIDHILSSRQRRPAGMEELDAERVPWFAWKTGTSSGRRDAWAVGHNRRFAIGVWVGRFSGAGHPEFVGKEAAEPLLAELFAHPQLRQDRDPEPPRPWAVERPILRPDSRAQPLHITTPAEGDLFLRVAGAAVINPRTNRAAGNAQWFLNGLHLGATSPERLTLDAGSYELRCVSTDGASAAVRFQVQ